MELKFTYEVNDLTIGCIPMVSVIDVLHHIVWGVYDGRFRHKPFPYGLHLLGRPGIMVPSVSMSYVLESLGTCRVSVWSDGLNLTAWVWISV
jgi:hypothetical protein